MDILWMLIAEVKKALVQNRLHFQSFIFRPLWLITVSITVYCTYRMQHFSLTHVVSEVWCASLFLKFSAPDLILASGVFQCGLYLSCFIDTDIEFSMFCMNVLPCLIGFPPIFQRYASKCGLGCVPG